jgi:hypothetical protein
MSKNIDRQLLHLFIFTAPNFFILRFFADLSRLVIRLYNLKLICRNKLARLKLEFFLHLWIILMSMGKS